MLAPATDGPEEQAPVAKHHRTDTEEVPFGTETTSTASPVTVVVSGPGGPCCTMEASTGWTILQVHDVIFEKISIPVEWQTLVKGTEKLGWEVTVGSLISAGSNKLQLTLLVVEVPEPAPTALLEAIERGDEATALQLLRRSRLPGLNDVNRDGETLLHRAVILELTDLAVAIATRPGFLGINAKDHWLHTALHYAAFRGFLPVCQAITGREDFTELLAVTDDDRTALERARQGGRSAVVQLLEEAGARLQEPRS